MATARAVRLAAALAFVALLVAPALPGATGGRVLAHAQLVASSPGSGANAAESPAELRLVFSEPLETQYTSLDLRTIDGTVVLEPTGRIDPDDPFALVADAPALDDGVYTVTWRTLSAADGHTAEGFFSFSVGDAEVPAEGGAGAAHSATSLAEQAWRWLTYAGLLLALGLPIFHAVVIRERFMQLTLRRAVAAGLLVAAGATGIAALGNALEAGAVGEYLLGSRNGGLQLARALVATLGGVALLVVPAGVAGVVAAGVGLIGLGLLVAAGHAAALPSVVPLLGQVVHVAAAAVWISGIVALAALAIRPDLLIADSPRPAWSTLVPRFSALALVSIGLLGLSGVYAAWTQTGVLLTLDTEYGRVLAIKTALAVAALSLGGLNYLDGGRLRSWLGGLRTRVIAEVALAAAVLFVTAALATTPPLEDAKGFAIEPIPDAFGRTAPGMEMEIVPGRPGVNRVVVTTSRALAAGTGLQLELSLDRLDDGSTTRVPLIGADGSSGHAAHGAGAAPSANADEATWMADALVLPAASRWDTSVRVGSSTSGDEFVRQRFAFALDDGGISEGRVTTLLALPTLIAALLVLGGALGVGLGIGGARLPRCDARASRVALLAGGLVAVTLGGAIGLDRLFPA